MIESPEISSASFWLEEKPMKYFAFFVGTLLFSFSSFASADYFNLSGLYSYDTEHRKGVLVELIQDGCKTVVIRDQYLDLVLPKLNLNGESRTAVHKEYGAISVSGRFRNPFALSFRSMVLHKLAAPEMYANRDYVWNEDGYLTISVFGTNGKIYESYQTYKIR